MRCSVRMIMVVVFVAAGGRSKSTAGVTPLAAMTSKPEQTIANEIEALLDDDDAGKPSNFSKTSPTNQSSMPAPNSLKTNPLVHKAEVHYHQGQMSQSMNVQSGANRSSPAGEDDKDDGLRMKSLDANNMAVSTRSVVVIVITNVFVFYCFSTKHF